MRRSRNAFVLLLFVALPLPAFAAQPIGKPIPVRIEFYRIAVVLEPETQQLTATTTLTLRGLVESVHTLPFEIENTLELDSIQDDRGRMLSATRVGPSYGHGYLLELAEPLAARERLDVTFRYHGRMAEKPLDYLTPTGVLLRDEARWYPIIDLSAVAGLEMRVTVPAGWEVITSGDLIERTTRGNQSTFFWRTERPVPSRSLAAGPFRVHQLELDGVDLYVYLSTADEPLAESLVARMSDILRFYGKNFGAYPWKRYSVVEGLPRPPGSTGYSAPGFLVASLRALRNHRYPLFDPQFLPHEVAHQWFPGEVPMARETDAFIAESLAEYCALLYLERSLPALAVREFVRKSHLDALAGKLLPLASGLRLFGWYDWPTVHRTLYQRGMLIYRTLHALMGDEAFLRLLREFYSRYRGRPASVGDFQALAEEIHGAPLGWFFDLYLRRTELPDIAISFEHAGNSLRGNLRVQNVPASFLLPVEVEIRLPAVGRASKGRKVLRALVLARRGDNFFELEARALAAQAVIDPDWKILFAREEIKRNRGIVALLERASSALQKSEYNLARDALRQALAADPEDLIRQHMWVTFMLGRVALWQRQYQASLDWMSRALRYRSYDPATTGLVHVWARIFRGDALERLGRRSLALAEYRKALQEAEPPVLESQFNLEESGRITTASEEISARLARGAGAAKAKPRR